MSGSAPGGVGGTGARLGTERAEATTRVAGGEQRRQRLAGLGQNGHPDSGKGRGKAEEEEESTGKPMEGSGRRVRASKGANGGEGRNLCAGEQSRARESGREEKERGAAFLTMRRNSRDARASRGSGGAAVRGGTELQSSNGGTRVWSGKGGGGLRRKAKNTGEAINRGGRGSLECAPRQGAVGRARPGLPELECRSGGRKGTGRRAGPACRPGEGGEAGVGLGREKRKRKLGRAEKSGEKGKGKDGLG